MDTGEWEDYSGIVSPPNWIQNYVAGGSISFDLNTSDTTLAGETFALRFATTDDEDTPNIIYDTFTVTFDYVCLTDTLTLTSASGNTDQDVIFTTSINVATAVASQTVTGCPMDSTLEVYVDASGTWIPYDDASS